jgi:hypothetical protein
MEHAIAVAPEQWWSLLAPIWPDIDQRATTGTGRLEPEAALDHAATTAPATPAPGAAE